MPHIIAIEYSESQRRQLHEKLSELTKNGWPLSGKYEAANFENWQDLFSNIIQPGLFAQRESIVIEEAESLGVFPENLINLVEDKNSDCMLILIFSSDTKTLKPIINSITLIKPEAQIPPWKRQSWLMDIAKSQGFKINSEAAQLLADSIESQEELRAEINKLALFADGREITVNDVENLSFDEGGRAQMLFLDGICDNKPHDVAKALKYLRNDPLLIHLTAITNRLRSALIISSFASNSQIDALKSIGIDTAKKPYALTKSRNAIKHFGTEKIKKFIFGAIRLSFIEKTNRAEGWLSFEMIIWELMAKI